MYQKEESKNECTGNCTTRDNNLMLIYFAQIIIIININKLLILRCFLLSGLPITELQAASAIDTGEYNFTLHNINIIVDGDCNEGYIPETVITFIKNYNIGDHIISTDNLPLLYIKY